MRQGLPALVGVVFTCALAFAHEGHDARYADLTRQLEARGGRDVESLFERGRLSRRAGAWHAALRDLTTVRRLEPEHDGWELEVARVFHGLRMFAAAEERLDAWLTRRPEDLAARRDRARVREARGAWEAAASDLARCVAARRGAHAPDDVFALVRVLLRCEGGAARAVGAIDAALIGGKEPARPIALVLRAIELERGLARHDAALRRIDELLSGPGRAEQWLALRAEVLQQAGRGAEAERDLRSALEAVRALPPNVRRKASTLELQRELERRLSALLSR